MKLLITVLLSVFLIHLAHAQLPGADFPCDKVKGKVSTITTLRYGVNINALYPYKMDTTYRDTTFYDEQGHLTSRHIKSGPWGHYKYETDTYQNKYNNGKIAGIITLKASERIVTIYDEDGFVIESDSYRNDGRLFKDKFIYDEEHRIVECDSYNVDGRIMQTIYKYNKKWLLTEEINGIFPATTTYDFSKFDKTGNWTKCISMRYAKVGLVLSTGKLGIGVDTETTVRQITYYQ
jgi:PKD repeat protein